MRGCAAIRGLASFKVCITRVEFLGSEWLAYGKLNGVFGDAKVLCKLRQKAIGKMSGRGSGIRSIACAVALFSTRKPTGRRLPRQSRTLKKRFDRWEKYKAGVAQGRYREEEILCKGVAGGHKEPPQRRERVGIADRDGVVGALMLAPAVIYMIALVAVPFFLAIALSLSDATVGNPGIHHFVGLDNFTSLVREAAFMFAFRNSRIIAAATLVLLTVLTILQVEILAGDFPGKRIVEALLILP
jgi:hypothetical protein